MDNIEPSSNGDIQTETESKKDEKKRMKNESVSLMSLFGVADRVDCFLMFLGGIGACTHGATLPVFFVFFGKMLDSLGNLSTEPKAISSRVSQNALHLVYIGLVTFVSAWIGETQARLRINYLKSILAKDITFFDIEARDSNLISHISSDAILVQDAIGDKVRTVYAFVEEEKAVNSYSNSIKKALKLGKRSSLAKGLGVGLIYSLLFCAWALLLWYASLLVRHGKTNGAKALTTILNVIFSGFALGQGTPSLSVIELLQ